MNEGGSGWLCGNAQSYRSEGSWFESRSWRFTDCGLILGKCHPSSFHSQPTPHGRSPTTCVTDYRFLTLYDHSSRRGRKINHISFPSGSHGHGRLHMVIISVSDKAESGDRTDCDCVTQCRMKYLLASTRLINCCCSFVRMIKKDILSVVASSVHIALVYAIRIVVPRTCVLVQNTAFSWRYCCCSCLFRTTTSENFVDGMDPLVIGVGWEWLIYYG